VCLLELHVEEGLVPRLLRQFADEADHIARPHAMLNKFDFRASTGSLLNGVLLHNLFLKIGLTQVPHVPVLEHAFVSLWKRDLGLLLEDAIPYAGGLLRIVVDPELDSDGTQGRCHFSAAFLTIKSFSQMRGTKFRR